LVNAKIIAITVVVIIAVIVIAVAAFNAISASNRAQETQTASQPLPVLLIHGWNEDASIWKTWQDLLNRDNIKFYTVTFQNSDDKCADAIAHATELGRLVETAKRESGLDRVNIVGHSKGGLDARVYLANGTKDVENLIMIGTPNAGTQAAETTNICKPGIWDLLPDATATKAKENPNTKYWTIAGDWLHDSQGNPALPGPDDGLVQVNSVESEDYFKNLGRTSHAHADLLAQDEYNLAHKVLEGVQS